MSTERDESAAQEQRLQQVLHSYLLAADAGQAPQGFDGGYPQN